MRHSRRFKELNAEATKKEFIKFLKEEDEWFGHLLYGIKEGWVNRGCNITEILIREGDPVSVSVLKAYIPCKCHDGDEEFKPTQHQILNIVKRFTEIDAQSSDSSTKFEGASIDFSFQVFGLGIFRVNYSRSDEGTGLSIRYLPFNVPNLSSVGYPEMYHNFINGIVENVSVKQSQYVINLGSTLPKDGLSPTESLVKTVKTAVPRSGGGLILHIGPTSSGKTTSMASEIDLIANETSGLIITYEDPIEFVHIGTQSPVVSFELGHDIKANKDFTLAEVVQQHALRNNPSVIMFGEMRTPEQMRMVVSMANRGHWVFASMHGNAVYEAVGVLAALFKDEPHVLANSLKAAVAHRLATNSKGEIVPLFEIFIPDQVRTDALAKGDIDAINTTFKESLGNQSVTFEDSLKNLLRDGKIDQSEMDRIRKTAFGNMSKKKENN